MMKNTRQTKIALGALALATLVAILFLAFFVEIKKDPAREENYFAKNHSYTNDVGKLGLTINPNFPAWGFPSICAAQKSDLISNTILYMEAKNIPLSPAVLKSRDAILKSFTDYTPAESCKDMDYLLLIFTQSPSEKILIYTSQDKI